MLDLTCAWPCSWCRWTHPPSSEGLQALAGATPGWAGADLKSLCASAVIEAVRRGCAFELQQFHDEQLHSVPRADDMPGAQSAPAEVDLDVQVPTCSLAVKQISESA